MMFETSTHAPSLTDQTSMPCGYQQISSLSTTPPHQSHGQSLLNLLQYNSQEKDNNNNPYSNEVNSKVDDDFEFLWDMNIEENSLGDHVHGVASNLEDMRFEIGNNSTVFL